MIDRIQGAAQLRKYLAWQDIPGGRTKPRFYIFDTCPISFDCLTRMEHDPDRVEDVLKIDAVDGDPYTGDDAYDMIRMALMSRPMITDELLPNHPIGSKGWYEQQAKDIWERERAQIEKLQGQTNDWPSES